jgi:CHAD domain-containing protein
MAKHGSIVDRRAADAVADVVSRHLDAARRALRRADAGGLHAFRVALRRARTALKAHRRWVPDVRRKDRRRLRRLARGTNAGRDADVLLPLLSRLARDLPAAERPDATALRRRLRRARHAETQAVDDLRDGLRRAARPIRRRLRAAARSGSRPSFGEALGELLAADAATLAAELATLATSDAPAALHAARLTVKRVRYLLEPVRRDVPGAGAAVADLQRLQTRLGELHDLDVLGELLRSEIGTAHDAPAGLLSLDRLLAVRRAEMVRRLREDWVRERAPALADAVAALAHRLVPSRSEPVAAPGARSRSLGSGS